MNVWLPRLFRHPRVSIGVGLVVAAVGLVGLVANLFAPANFDSRPGEVLLLLGAPVNAVVGAYLVWRRPDHPIGHLLVLVGLGMGVDSPAKAILNLRLGPVDGPLRQWSVVVENTSWSITFWAVAVLLLVYPDGRLLTPRWRWVVRVATAAEIVLFAACLLAGRDVSGPYADVRSPLPFAYDEQVGQALAFPLLLAMVGCIVLGVVSLFLRLRRGRRVHDAVTTAQVRWLAWAGLLAIVMVASQGWIDDVVGRWVPWLGNVVSELGPFALTIAIVVAVTRHGLFEIDRIVSRTVGYTLITVLLVGAYVGIIAGLSALLPTRSNSFVVAGATLAVVGLFVPVRRSVQRRVDRRFNRARHDHAVLVEGFAGRVRRDDAVAPADDLLAVVGQAFEPSHAGLWLASR